MKSVYVEAIGVCAPGLPDWGTCLRVLRGQVEYLPIDISELVPLSLGPNERRRTTPQIKLALHVAEQAVAHSMSNIEGLVATFASSEGDIQVVDKVCAALIHPGRPVSPMQFHNIVHNAPAGYWSIGHHASNCSTSIAASNDTFLAGLLYAYSTLIAEEVPVLLVCSDHPGPNVLNKYRPVSAAFGVAMIMMPERSPQ